VRDFYATNLARGYHAVFGGAVGLSDIAHLARGLQASNGVPCARYLYCANLSCGGYTGQRYGEGRCYGTHLTCRNDAIFSAAVGLSNVPDLAGSSYAGKCYRASAHA
jgi:hypothetical protein